MFDDFTDEFREVGGLRLRLRHAGTGPAVLLIHGHPRTGATWHRVAPRLVEGGYSVVCPDMRGYGRSEAPVVRPDHSQQSKRAVAADLVSLMGDLGHERFSVVGHDRGCYVALRMALDAPERVDRLVVMDGVPISEALDRCDAKFAQAWWHWFFFAQPEIPERVINADPDAWYRADRSLMGEANYEEFRIATRDPDTVRAMLEDYRAGLGIDREHEERDRAAGNRIQCPTLLLWSTRDDLVDLYGDPLEIWRRWAPGVRGLPIESGHHLAEENPAAVATAIAGFLGGGVT
jgi:haloacetate dehalogenase